MASGLIGAIELVADKKTKRNFEAAKGVGAKCGQFCQEEGIIVRPLLHDRIALCPPLVISEAEIDELFDRLERGLDRTLDWVRKRRHLFLTQTSCCQLACSICAPRQ